MFREMRRKKQMLSDRECVAVLNGGTSGVLAVSGDGGYPYAVPLSYVYHDGTIYFHCAKEGHKLDAIAREEKASFCVIARDQVAPERYTTHYCSVIAFGRARTIEDEKEKRQALALLAAKYTPDDEQGRLREIDRFFANVTMIALTIEHMSGKQAAELAEAQPSEAGQG